MFGSNAPPDISVVPAADALTADVKPAIVLLLAAVALLLATATANVGSLQLARATARRRELAVRAAIGAGTGRLVRQVIVESSLIGMAGGIAGVGGAMALHRVLPALLPADFPRIDDIAVDLPVLAFAVVVSMVASIASGALPSLAARRVELVDALSDEPSGSAGAWRSRAGRLRTLVMAAQIGVACVLLAGSALLGRSFYALTHADRGYDPASVLTARIDLPRRYDGAARVAFADAVVGRLRAAPGIASAAAANALPLLSIGGTYGFSMPVPSNPGVSQTVQTMTRMVGPEYFHALRLRLLEGRLLTDADTITSRPVIVVNRSFARQYLGPSPIGKEIPMPFGQGRRGADVVGIVDDMRQGDVTDAPAAEVFISYRQLPDRVVSSPMVFVVRTSDDPMSHVAMLRTAVSERDPTVAIDSILTMDDRLAASLGKPRLYVLLLSGLALAALAIAGVGLFGVLSYVVAQRSREIGIRTALGAQVSDIVGLIGRQAAAVVGAGLAAGLLTSLAAARLLGSFLYGVTQHDAMSLGLAALVVMVVATAASVIPARRAAKVDPLIVLKGN